jgi:ADP-heptose:LPS heptosyltransferase
MTLAATAPRKSSRATGARTDAQGTTLERPLQPAVIRFGRLGDMVMLTALLELLHRRFGRRCLVLAAGPWSAPLLETHADVEQLWSLPRHFPLALTPLSWRALWALRRAAPGPIYVCENQPRQVRRIRWLLRLGGISPARCLYVTEALPGEAGEGHWIDRLARFARCTPAALAGADYPAPAEGTGAAPQLQVAVQERAELDAWLAARGWSGRALVLIQPGNFRTMSRRREHWAKNNADDKAWPEERWVALLAKIARAMPEALLVLCGTPQEAPMLSHIQHSAQLSQVVLAELPMRRLLSLCGVAHSMISIDTGPAHAAAACGLPLLVLFGGQPARDWLPRSASGSPVTGLGGPPRSTRVDALSVDEVFAAWCALSRAPAASALPAATPTREQDTH